MLPCFSRPENCPSGTSIRSSPMVMRLLLGAVLGVACGFLSVLGRPPRSARQGRGGWDGEPAPSLTSTRTGGPHNRTPGVLTPGLGRRTMATTTRMPRRIMEDKLHIQATLVLDSGMIPTDGNSSNGGMLLARGYKQGGLLDIGTAMHGIPLPGRRLHPRVPLRGGVKEVDRGGLFLRQEPMMALSVNSHSPPGMILVPMILANEMNVILAMYDVMEVNNVTADGYAPRRRGPSGSTGLGCLCQGGGTTMKKGSIEGVPG